MSKEGNSFIEKKPPSLNPLSMQCCDFYSLLPNNMFERIYDVMIMEVITAPVFGMKSKRG